MMFDSHTRYIKMPEPSLVEWATGKRYSKHGRARELRAIAKRKRRSKS